MEIFSRKKWKFLEFPFFPRNGNFWNFHFFPKWKFLEMEIFGNGNFWKWKFLEGVVLTPGRYWKPIPTIPIGLVGKVGFGVVLTPGRYWKPIPTIPIGLVGKVVFGVFLTLVKIYIFRNKSLVHLHKKVLKSLVHLYS